MNFGDERWRNGVESSGRWKSHGENGARATRYPHFTVPLSGGFNGRLKARPRLSRATERILIKPAARSSVSTCVVAVIVVIIVDACTRSVAVAAVVTALASPVVVVLVVVIVCCETSRSRLGCRVHPSSPREFAFIASFGLPPTSPTYSGNWVCHGSSSIVALLTMPESSRPPCVRPFGELVR